MIDRKYRLRVSIHLKSSAACISECTYRYPSDLGVDRIRGWLRRFSKASVGSTLKVDRDTLVLLGAVANDCSLTLLGSSGGFKDTDEYYLAVHWMTVADSIFDGVVPETGNAFGCK